ncbi:hypothetical protein Q5752_000614 [Cryptotrichosporon argae]
MALSSDTKVIASATAPGTSRRAVLSASDDCWTAPACPATLHLIPPAAVPARQVALTFQGGFAATSVAVYVAVLPNEDGGDISLGLELGGKIHPEDKNARQVFDIPWPPSIQPAPITEIKFEFETSADVHGRVTVYQVELL